MTNQSRYVKPGEVYYVDCGNDGHNRVFVVQRETKRGKVEQLATCYDESVARQFCAAPELLEALIHCAETANGMFDTMFKEPDTRNWQVIRERAIAIGNIARAAIAKARGEVAG